MANSNIRVHRNPLRRVTLFFSEMIQELRKAAWPTPAELRTSTLVVLVAVCLLGLFLSVSDFSIYNLVTFLTHLVISA
jgi:preprotein translocase subunit SecE